MRWFCYVWAPRSVRGSMGTRRGRACLVLCWVLCAGLFVPTEVGTKASLEERLLLGTKPGEQPSINVASESEPLSVPLPSPSAP